MMVDTRDDLLEQIKGCAGEIKELEVKRTEGLRRLKRLAEAVLSGGGPDVAGFTKIRDDIEYADAMLAELRNWHKNAQLELWQFDLDALKAELLKAVQAVRDTRTEILQCQTDKSAYLRDASGAGTTLAEKTEKVAAFDVLMVDARSRAQTATTYRDKLRADLEVMQSNYNELAKEFGWPIEPEKPEPAPQFGLT